MRVRCTMMVATLLGAATVVQASPPLAPTVTWPPTGALLDANRVDVTWSGSAHDQYEIHVGLYNIPGSAEGWDSGIVSVAQPATTAETAALPPQQTYYVFIRLHNSEGWGPWSAPFHWFYVAGELLNDPYDIAGPDGSQWPFSVCFNPDRNEYLVAYADKRANQRWNISYYRLNSIGQRIGSEVTITSDTNLDGVHEPAVIYNSVNHEYFIAYDGWDEQPTLHDEERGQRVDAATGALLGSSWYYTTVSGSFEPRIGYSPASNAYLMSWHQNQDGQADIGTIRLAGATGAPLGPVVNLTAGDDRYSAMSIITRNSSTDEFLVLWQVSAEDVGQSWNYRAQRIRATNGALAGSIVDVTNGAASEDNGGAVYVPELDRYFLVYESPIATDQTIWGQFLLPSGAPVGSRLQLDAPGFGGGVPKVAWNPTRSEFLVTWMSCCTYGNFGRRLAADGTPIGLPFRFNGTVLGIGNWNPVPLWNAVAGEYLITWFSSYNDVWDRRYKPYALPPPDTQPPDPVTALTSTRYASAVKLAWTNPSTPDFAGAMLRMKMTGYPTGPTDGVLVVDQANAPSSLDSFVHTGLARGTYYYSLFAHDEVPNYAAAAKIRVNILPGDFDDDGDIDQTDFGHIQGCLSGDAMPYAARCQDADLDGDNDVDAADVSSFIRCMGGPDQSPGC